MKQSKLHRLVLVRPSVESLQQCTTLVPQTEAIDLKIGELRESGVLQSHVGEITSTVNKNKNIINNLKHSYIAPITAQRDSQLFQSVFAQ